jgi:hypothetical protein
MNELVDASLRHCESIEILDELPTGERYYLPNQAKDSGRDGLIVRFAIGSQNEWVGVFAFGEHGKTFPSRVVPLPDSDQVVVVSAGAGYLVHEQVPGSCERVKSVPVRIVCPVVSHGLLVLADDTTLVAYGSNGLAWETGRIGWNNVRIRRVDNSCIHGTTFDIRSDENISFSVDARSGAVHGGVEIP